MMSGISVIGDDTGRRSRYNRNLANLINARVAREFKENKKVNIDSAEMPRIHLNPLSLIAVSTPKESNYDRLMEIYEAGDWKWVIDKKITSENCWSVHGKTTCVTCGIDRHVENSGIIFYSDKKWFEDEGYEIISEQDFYVEQNLTTNELYDIWGYFSRRRRDLK